MTGRRIPLWVEPYAGSLAVGLRLLGGRPLVGWMGGKMAYADAIMDILRVGSADEVWCADVGDWAQVWRALARDGVAREAADIIDGYEADALSTGDSPRSYHRVWTREREVWRAKGTTVDAEGVARWLALVRWSAMGVGPKAGAARVSEDTWRSAKSVARFNSPATRLRALPSPLPVRVWHDAAAIPPRSGAVVMLDPPYAGTTGYQHGEGQHGAADAARVRDAWLKAGSVVACCEQVPDGLACYDITRRRINSRNHHGMPAATREMLTVHAPR